MKILLINPPTFDGREFSREGRCMQRKDFWSFTWPPLTLALCAAMARRQGWEAHIYDGSSGGADKESLNRRTREEFKQWLRDLSPDLVIANTGTPSIDTDLSLAPLVKEVLPNARMGYLGIHVSEFDKATLEENPAVDLIVRGEPEYSIEALTQAGGDPRGVAGITWRDGTGITREPDRGFQQDLSDLPRPAWDLVNPSNYRLPNNGHPFLLVSTVRGCPYACTYCHTQKFYGKRLRYRPVGDLVDEVEWAQRDYGVNHFLFWSELFTADRKYVLEVCSEIVRRQLAIHWATSSRVDYVDPEMLDAMKRSGCWLIAFGIESGDQRVLDLNKKKAQLQEAKMAVHMSHAAGLEVAGHFVIGMPGETEDSALATVRFARETGVDYAQFYCAVPFPGSELYQQALANNWLVPGAKWEDYDQTRSVLSYPGGLQAADIERLRALGYRSFYSQPRILLKGLKQVRSWSQVRQLARIAVNFA